MHSRSFHLAAGSLLVLLASVVASFTAMGSDSWPGFRGPNGDGRAPGSAVATTWSEGDHVRWKTSIHGKGWSSPVVLGNEVWLTTADELRDDSTAPAGGGKGGPPENQVKELNLFAIGVDRATGKILHDVKLGSEKNPAYCHPFNSYASSTPFIEEGRLYAHFGSHGTWCVDTTTGKILWERRDLPCNHFRGPASSPLVSGDRVYLIFDGFDQQYVVALDKATGSLVWKTDRAIKYSSNNGDMKKAYATPGLFVIDGKPELICPSAECTQAYDPKTGAELWRISHGGMNGAGRPILSGGLLYLTSGHSGKLMAVNPSGSGVLPREQVVWQAVKNVPSRPSVLVDDDLLYMVSDNGIASCLDAGSGKVYWSERLDGEFSASPVMAGQHLYLCNQSGKTFVLARGKTYNLVAENRLKGGFMASPAIAGNDLYLRTKTDLYCIGAKAQ